MKIVKTSSGYKIKVGWWIFGYYIKEQTTKLEDLIGRKDRVFDTYEQAQTFITNQYE